MPLFATCTIANAILALCAPPGALTFSSACLMACHAAALVCAVPGRRSGASVRLPVWPRNFGRDLPRLPCAELSMRTISMDLTRYWRPGMAQRTRRVDGTAAAPAIASGRLASCLRLGRKAAPRAACRRHRPRVHDGIANP